MSSLQDEVDSLRVQARNAQRYEAELEILRERLSSFESSASDVTQMKAEYTKLVDERFTLVWPERNQSSSN